MSNYSFDIRLADEYITIGPVPVVPRGQPVAVLTRLLGAPDRIVPLSHGNTVYIYDNLGIRFWAEDSVVGELQLVLETDDGKTLPTCAFGGPLEYRGYPLLPPVPGSVFANNALPDFVQDTDRLQYQMVVYNAKLLGLTYTAILSKHTGNIQYLSIH